MASGDTLVSFSVGEMYPTIANGADYDERAGNAASIIPVIAFDGVTDQEITTALRIFPRNYAGGGVTINIHTHTATATTGTSRWQTDIERTTGQDIDSDGFTGTFQSGTAAASGTSGIATIAVTTHTAGAQMDSLAVGELFRLKLRRDADGTSGTDDITTDVQVTAVEIKET